MTFQLKQQRKSIHAMVGLNSEKTYRVGSTLTQRRSVLLGSSAIASQPTFKITATGLKSPRKYKH